MTEIKIPSKHSLSASNDGFAVLNRDGKPMICHKIQPYIEPSNVGGTRISRSPCGTHCPLLSVDVKDDQPIVKIACGSVGITYLITAEKQSTGKIINL